MAGKINNLFEIISAPGLEDSKYGEHINAQFNNINENFAALANREFVQGPDGQGVNVVEIKFVGSNLTTQSPYITISKDLEASIKAAFETYNPDNQDWYKDITCSAYLDSDEKLHSIYPIIYSEVVEDIFNDDDVTESTTKSDFRSLQFDYDESGKLCLTKYDQNFPSIEYNQEVGDFCWVLNGKVTEITARGPQGERGEDADSFDTLIVNQEPISKDSDLHEITHIYVDGALRELTPQIKTPADILWYNKFRQVWINNNIDKIFITAGPSKTESEAKTINYFGKMIKHKKSTQNTQSANTQSANTQSANTQNDNTQSDNTPAQKTTVLTSKRPPIIIGVQPGVTIDKADAAGAIDKIINVGEIDPAVKDYVDNHKDTIALQIAQASNTVYCMKLSPGTVFNMTMMAQTTSGTLYDELSGTYPGTDKGSTQALFLWDGKNKEAYTLQKPENGLVIGYINDYTKCQRGSASSANLKPDPLVTIQNEGNGITQLNGSLTVTRTTTQLNSDLTVAKDKATTLGGELKVTGKTQLNSDLTVAKDKATTLGGTLKVTGATTLNDSLTVVGATTLNNELAIANTIITSNDFNTYFQNTGEGYSYQGNYSTQSSGSYGRPDTKDEFNVIIINTPLYIKNVIINFDQSSKLNANTYKHYIGENFDFYIKKVNSNLYKIYGDIELFDEHSYFGWFSLDCYFERNQDNIITIKHHYVRNAGGLGVIEYGLAPLSDKGVNKFKYGINTRLSIDDLSITMATDWTGNTIGIGLVAGGIGIYKKDSLLNDSTSQYMAGTNIFNDLKGHQADLKPYSFYTVYLPYWATCLSSDFPAGMPTA